MALAQHCLIANKEQWEMIDRDWAAFEGLFCLEQNRGCAFDSLPSSFAVNLLLDGCGLEPCDRKD